MEVLGVVRLLAEAGVVIGQETRKQLIAGGNRTDTLQTKLLDQAILHRVAAATIRASLDDADGLGIEDGFEWLMQGDVTHVRPLTIEGVSRTISLTRSGIIPSRERIQYSTLYAPAIAPSIASPTEGS